MWPFKKKKANVEPAANNDLFHLVFERKAMPDPGAQNYALETLGLVQFSPIGPSVTTRRPLRVTRESVYSGQAVVTNGIPVTAGQVYGQPLFDPNAPNGGFAKGLPLDTSPLVALNDANVTGLYNIGPNATTLRQGF